MAVTDNQYGDELGAKNGHPADPKKDVHKEENQPQGDPFEDWYKNEIQAHPEKYDTGRSKEQWQAWFPLWTGHGFKSSKVDAQGKPIEGDNFEHPDACPSGTTAYGQNQCLPLNDPHVTGQKPGGPAPPGGNGTGPGAGHGPGGGLGDGTPAPGFSNLALTSGMSGLDEAAAFWKNVMGGTDSHSKAENFALTSQQTGQVNDALDAQRQNIIATIPAGGERDQALADIEKQRTSVTAQVRGNLANSAMGNLQSIYGTQAGLGSGLRQQDIGYNLGASGLANQLYGLNIGKDLGYAQLGEKANEFSQGLDWTKTAFGQNFNQHKTEFDTGQSDWQKQFDWNAAHPGSNGLWDSIGQYFASDERLKKDIEPHTAGLEELKKIEPIAFRYKDNSKDSELLKGFSAQNVEKHIPEAVVKYQGDAGADTKAIHPMTILATTVNAVKELEQRMKNGRNLSSPKKGPTLSNRLKIPKAIKGHTVLPDVRKKGVL